MLTSLLTMLVAVLATAVASPDAVYRLAALDLAERVAPQKRRVTRYLSLYALKPEERVFFLQALTSAINRVSFRSQFVPLTVLGPDRLLVRIDLEALQWDRASRILRRAELEKRGVKYVFKDKAEEERFLDPWEDFVSKDVYFKVTHEEKGKVVRGWLDPAIEESARNLSYSSSLVLRADWLLPRLLTEKERGGFYSELLMLPATEQDLQKMFLIPVAEAERSTQLRYGGAVVKSIVALHSRELELLPSPYGYDEKYYWRTRDVLNDADANKNVLQTFGGNIVHDGREIIGTLPNGLTWSYLADGKGKQVEVVPQAIALDMRRDVPNKQNDKLVRPPIRDRNVVNAISCISCHGPSAGIQPFQDVVRNAILNPEIGLAVISYDQARASGKAYELEDFYRVADANGGLARDVIRQQESYAKRVEEMNGLDPEADSWRLVGFFDQYVWDNVTPEQAAREMGVGLEEAKAAWRVSGNSELVVLSSGQEIRRSGWERAFADAMRARVYAWEKSVKHN